MTKPARIGRQRGLHDTETDYQLMSHESRAITRQNVARLTAQGFTPSAISKALSLTVDVVQRLIDEG